MPIFFSYSQKGWYNYHAFKESTNKCNIFCSYRRQFFSDLSFSQSPIDSGENSGRGTSYSALAVALPPTCPPHLFLPRPSPGCVTAPAAISNGCDGRRTVTGLFWV